MFTKLSKVIRAPLLAICLLVFSTDGVTFASFIPRRVKFFAGRIGSLLKCPSKVPIILNK